MDQEQVEVVGFKAFEHRVAGFDGVLVALLVGVDFAG